MGRAAIRSALGCSRAILRAAARVKAWLMPIAVHDLKSSALISIASWFSQVVPNLGSIETRAGRRYISGITLNAQVRGGAIWQSSDASPSPRRERSAVTPQLLAALAAAKSAKKPVILATRLPDGTQKLLPHPEAGAALNEQAERALADDESRTVRVGEESWFLQAHTPPLRLVVVGAVHIAQALVPLAAQLGMAVIVVDPRRSFANDERFPNVSISADWPDEALDALKPDTRTAIVTLTHDPKLDDPALDRAVKSPAFYIGALGSRRTHAASTRAQVSTSSSGTCSSALWATRTSPGPKITHGVSARLVNNRMSAP